MIRFSENSIALAVRFAITMTDAALIDEVNERLFALDEAVANARAFRALLEDLQARDVSGVQEPHVTAITMVRAGLLRAAISTVMACLDPSDRRGNRASVGQILDLLQDARLAAAVFSKSQAAAANEVLERLKRDYDALLNDELLKRGKRLRNDAIAHIPDPRRSHTHCQL